MKKYKDMYERLVCAITGLKMGCLLLKSNGITVISLDNIIGGIEKAIKESEE